MRGLLLFAAIASLLAGPAGAGQQTADADRTVFMEARDGIRRAFGRNRSAAEPDFIAAMQSALEQGQAALADDPAATELDRTRLLYEWARARFAYPNAHAEATNQVVYTPRASYYDFIESLDPARIDLLEDEYYVQALIAWRDHRAEKLRRTQMRFRQGDNLRLRTQLEASAFFARPAIRCFLDASALTAQLEDFEADGIADEPQAHAERCPGARADAIIDGFNAELALRNGHEIEIYKTAGGVDLEIHLFEPNSESPAGPASGSEDAPRPAVVWLHGGGWHTGSWSWCGMCEWYKQRGFVVAQLEYRISGRHNSTVADSVMDAADAIAFLRANADRLNIDPDRILASGFSAGGHMALSTAVLPQIPVGSRPNAAIGFSACTDLLDTGWSIGQAGGEAPARAWSPLHNARENLPPLLIFNGARDHLCHAETVEGFVADAEMSGGDAQLVMWPEAGHFSIYSSPEQQEESHRVLDGFLERAGIRTAD